jgi:hypothetical protein
MRGLDLGEGLALEHTEAAFTQAFFGDQRRAGGLG